MKRKVSLFIIILIVFIFIGISALFFDFNDNDNKNTKITVAEVAHTIFYAPQYVAIENGYFKEYGIDIELILANGADKVTAAVLSGDADIGFSGSEATIYVYNGGEKDYLKTFAQLTQKDGSFLVSRKKIDNFTLDDLKGKHVIAGRAFGMPEMTLKYAIKQGGINPDTEVELDTSIAFAAMSGAFISGQGDFVSLFEPNALDLEKNGYGYVVASVGELGGIVPYTSYSARISFIEENKELISNFTKAIQKGIDYVHNHSDREVAEVILDQFPDTSLNDLEKVIARYREIDAWPDTTVFTEESFNHLQEIMLDYGAIDKKVPYGKLIYNEN